MKYLVDANVLSEATRPSPSHKVVDWLRRHESQLVLSPIVLGEIEYGILLLSAGKRRRRLQEWFDRGIARFTVLEFDTNTARIWAKLLAKLKRSGAPMPIKDSLIAASALQHDWYVATRNVADFRRAGVKVVDPFK
jgi:predicted nucleic acid-binding protein